MSKIEHIQGKPMPLSVAMEQMVDDAPDFDFVGEGLDLGRVVMDGVALKDRALRLPLSMLNRHGLVAGSTGTGKTTTLRLLAEQLSRSGISVFAADMKGDLSGIAVPAVPSETILARAKVLGVDWKPWSPPVQLWSLTGRRAPPILSTIHDFGPALLGRILDLNEAQAAVLSVAQKWVQDCGHRINTVDDLRYILGRMKAQDVALLKYGGVPVASVAVIQRRLVDFDLTGATPFFGDVATDVTSMIQLDEDGFGYVNILDLTDIQDQTSLFSTAMLWLLDDLYRKLPERGDQPKPLLVFFLDEAHLLFNGAPKALLNRIEQILKLIRSKGVGVYFVTQTAVDVPGPILTQCANRIQHAIRAFTPRDRQFVKQTSENFPASEFYDVTSALTSMQIGEALVSVLGPSGSPLPTVIARIAPPTSRMGPLTEAERQEALAYSPNAVGWHGLKLRKA